MCNYCGCRQFPLIRLFTEQHEAIEEAAGALRRAILDGSHARAVRLLDALLDLLAPHTAVEEGGLFAEVHAEGTAAEAVERLCAEHRDIHGVLAAVGRADPDWPAVVAALHRLCRHIDNEEHGLFPAAVIALPIAACDRNHASRIRPSVPGQAGQLHASVDRGRGRDVGGRRQADGVWVFGTVHGTMISGAGTRRAPPAAPTRPVTAPTLSAGPPCRPERRPRR